jgi:alpha,alpha-trehalase
MKTRLVLDPGECDAVIFDLDGVITDTASVHASAWKQLFDQYLLRRAEREGGEFRPFDIGDDYKRYVDGKPRYDGVRAFLGSRGIELEEGSPEDEPDRESICGLGNRKNERFLERLREEGVKRFEDTVQFIGKLHEAGIRTAVISASKNARHVLEKAGVMDLFEARVDGVVAAQEGLKGKPAPDVFLDAARRLGVVRERAAIAEDAIAGVEAGRAGAFRWVIGVARSGSGERLRGAGADVVISNFSEISVQNPSNEGLPINELPSAFENLDEITDAARGREVAFFLDYDGTLSPIVDHPEDATLPHGTKELLDGLSRRRRVALVSGRDLDDLRDRVGLDRLYYAGSHGFCAAGPGGWREEHREARRFLPALDRAEEALERVLRSIQGVQVERKRYAIAVHFRRAREGAEEEVRHAVEEVQSANRELRISGGRKVFELRPAIPWDKGKAVAWILDVLGLDGSSAFPLYIGDDVTDEDAFRAIESEGLGIVVRGRDGRTRARYSLDDPDAVRRFLAKLDEKLGEK